MQAANQRVLVQLLVRAHAWVAGQVLSGGHMRGNHTLMFLSLSFSHPSPLSKKKKKRERDNFDAKCRTKTCSIYWEPKEAVYGYLGRLPGGSDA